MYDYKITAHNNETNTTTDHWVRANSEREAIDFLLDTELLTTLTIIECSTIA